MQKFVIIGGIGRSGTNLARRIIGSHSKIAIPPGEFRFFQNYAKGKTVKEILANERLKKWNIEFSDLYDLKPRDFYIQTLARYAETIGKEIPGEKTPFNEYYFNEIQDLLKGIEIKFIHLVRNPFDVMASFKHFGIVNSKNVFKKRNISNHIFNWKRSTSIGLARAYNNPESYYLLKFEDLISNPKHKTKELCEFIEVNFEEERMLSLSDYKGHKDNTSFPGSETKMHPIYNAIQQPESRKQYLTEQEIRQISIVCGELAFCMGYLENEFRSISDKKTATQISDKIKRYLIKQFMTKAL